MAINERDIFWDWQAACEQQDVEAQKELAHYVLEDLNEVAKIFHEAKAYLKDPSFYAYESDDPPWRAREEVKALYECLQDRKPKAGGDYLAYVLEDVKSVRVRGKQRVRLAREVLFWGHGVCLEWVLLFAACIFHAHIYPLIIVTREHAVLGYWLREDDAKTFGQVVLSGADVKRLFDEQRIKVINATRIPPAEDSKLKPFDEAEEEAETHLPYALFAVDIQKAREKGIKPLLPLDPWSRNHTLPPAEHFQWRPELEEIKNWWRHEDSYGVLALIGIGGAGKTALARRFLAQLPNSDIQDPKVGKDETLPVPDALFVWDFYTHPDVDQCATELYNYLTQKQADKATFEQVQDVLSRNWRGCRVLFVFDGVEKLQIAPGIEPEKEGGTFGQFLSEGAPLAQFLRWCCNSPRPVHVLITSRFGLTDLPGGYCPIDLGDLPLKSARDLLRAAGVKGLDWQLDKLIEEFGNHAQTLDLLGNALRIWCDGDPIRVNELPSLEDIKNLPGIRDKALERVRVLRFYEQKLPKATLIVLQLLCAFRVIPVDDQLLTDIFLKEEPIECRIFASILGLTQKELKGHLLSLCQEYNLIQGKPKDSPKWFSVHPSIREYFYQRLDFLQKKILHECIWKRLESLRGVSPFPALVKERDQESLDLDLIEELIFHTLRSGYATLAIRYFLGHCSYEHFGKRLGAYTRGERILREFVSKEDPVDLPMGLPEFEQGYFFTERALFLRSLGELDKAAYYFEQSGRIAKKMREKGGPWGNLVNACVALTNLSETLLLQGRLGKAIEASKRALELEPYLAMKTRKLMTQGIPGQTHEAAKQYCLVRIVPRAAMAAVQSQLGDVGNALENFAITLKIQVHGLQDKEFHYSTRGIWYAQLLTRLGKLAEAFYVNVRNREVCQEEDWLDKVPLCDLLFAELARLQGKSGEAHKSAAQALAWGNRTADQVVLVWGNLVCACIALDTSSLIETERAVREGLRIAEYCGYGLYWIDLQVAKAQWELACGRQLREGRELPPELEIWTPRQWFERAEVSALRGLNGQLKNSDEPAPQPDLPEDQLVMLGARHPECGYAWGEGDALHILAEARFELAQCIGPEGHDSEGRSYEQLLEEARQAAGEALALRKRIQDPKAKETWDLLRKIQECENDSR